MQPSIIAFEVGNRQTYERRFTHPYTTGGPTGVNIGLAYDLGHVSKEQFRKDWIRSIRSPFSGLQARRAAEAKLFEKGLIR